MALNHGPVLQMFLSPGVNHGSFLNITTDDKFLGYISFRSFAKKKKKTKKKSVTAKCLCYKFWEGFYI